MILKCPNRINKTNQTTMNGVNKENNKWPST